MQPQDGSAQGADVYHATSLAPIATFGAQRSWDAGGTPTVQVSCAILGIRVRVRMLWSPPTSKPRSGSNVHSCQLVWVAGPLIELAALSAVLMLPGQLGSD